MQKNENHSGELDKKLAAVCGLCCEGCTLFIATKEDLTPKLFLKYFHKTKSLLLQETLYRPGDTPIQIINLACTYIIA